MKISGRLLVLQSQTQVIEDQQLMEKAQNLALDVFEKILFQIEQGNLTINKNRVNLDINMNQSFNHHRSKSVPHLRFPVPAYTNQDEEKTKQMIYRQMQYQQKLQNKARLLEQAIKIDQIKSKQSLQQQKKKFFEEKKLKVLQSVQQMKQRRQQRQKLNKQQNKILMAVKSQKKLFEKLKQKWDKIQNQQKQQKQIATKELLQKRKISFDQIKQHAIQHDEALNKYRESRIALSRISQPQVKKFYESIFLSRVVQQNQQFKEDFQFKKNRAKQLAEKKAQYEQVVRQNFKPQVKQPLAPPPQIKANKSLSYFETVRKGNDYLKQGNARISQRLTAQSKINMRQKDKKQFFQYKNYLTEIRIKKDESQKQLNLNQRMQRQKKYQKQIQKIMKQPGLTEHQRFVKAKLVTKKMQSQAYRKNPLKIIDSINAKIQILKLVST